MEARLADLRTEIDSVDGQLVTLLARRFKLTHEVGIWKAQVGEAPLHPERQEQRKRLLTKLALDCGLDPALVFDLFARIQRETVANHTRLSLEEIRGKAALPRASR
jgi:chorismate mutase